MGNLGNAGSMSGAVAGTSAVVGQPFGLMRQTARQRQMRQPGAASTVRNAPGVWQLTGEVALGVAAADERRSRGAAAAFSPPAGLSSQAGS